MDSQHESAEQEVSPVMNRELSFSNQRLLTSTNTDVKSASHLQANDPRRMTNLTRMQEDDPEARENGELEFVSGPSTPPSMKQTATPNTAKKQHISSNSVESYRNRTHASSPRTPFFLSPRRLTPLGSPMRKMLLNMKGYLEDIGHLTTLKPQDTWLPITESRTGNSYYSAFHNSNAGIGFQALFLPVALTYLGWTWGIFALVVAYFWQLYTLWLLIQLHEAIPGKRCNRYIELAQAAFGERLGAWLATFPVLNLTAGLSAGLVGIGGSALKLFYKTVCGSSCGPSPLSTTEWYLVFACLCVVLAQLPNLNSIAGVSLLGATTAVAYCTLVWLLPVTASRLPGISYDRITASSDAATTFSIFNALGMVAFAFRGHNLVPEIQATMPSSLKHPAHVPMWRGAKLASIVIAACYFPVAIGGYWAYGNRILPAGMLTTLYVIHQRDISRGLLALTFIFVVLNSLSTFQIYCMSIYDMFEADYTKRTNRPCEPVVRVGFRVFFVFFSMFVGVAFPFISNLAGLLGGISSVPVTFSFPCFMWLWIKKPERYSFSWYLNWVLGSVATILGLAFTVGGAWSLVDSGLKVSFFKPQG